MKRADAVFSRQERSPDGTLEIWYNYVDGEKTPTVIEPAVTLVATGEVLIDFWRLGLNGSVDAFGPEGFQLTVTDSYGLATILVRVEVATRTFTLAGDPSPPRPLAALREVVFWIVDSRRQACTSPTAAAPRPAESSLSRVLRRFFR